MFVYIYYYILLEQQFENGSTAEGWRYGCMETMETASLEGIAFSGNVVKIGEF